MWRCCGCSTSIGGMLLRDAVLLLCVWRCCRRGAAAGCGAAVALLQAQCCCGMRRCCGPHCGAAVVCGAAVALTVVLLRLLRGAMRCCHTPSRRVRRSAPSNAPTSTVHMRRPQRSLCRACARSSSPCTGACVRPVGARLGAAFAHARHSVRRQALLYRPCQPGRCRTSQWGRDVVQPLHALACGSGRVLWPPASPCALPAPPPASACRALRAPGPCALQL